MPISGCSDLVGSRGFLTVVVHLLVKCCAEGGKKGLKKEIVQTEKVEAELEELLKLLPTLREFGFLGVLKQVFLWRWHVYFSWSHGLVGSLILHPLLLNL